MPNFSTVFAAHALWDLLPALPTFALLALIVALALSGCMGQTAGPVDLNNPTGLWNTIVYALAKVLIAINDFIAAYNDKATPFVWRKREVKGSQLRNTIVNLRN